MIFLACDGQVILDLGHVTFGSVSDWSEEQEKNLEQAVLLDSTPATETDDDEGKPCQLHSAIQSCDCQGDVGCYKKFTAQ